MDFASVYHEWFQHVLRWSRAMGGPEADLEDLAQEVFVVVRRKLEAFDGRNLAGRDQHLDKFAAAGVIGLLFGANDGASDQTDDYYTDGQLFLKSRASSFLRAGGFPLRP
jgi:hypothetical protein